MSFLVILLFVLMLATAVVLVVGIGSMARNSEEGRKHSHKLMVARVTLQAMALVVFGLLFLLGRPGA